MRVTVGTAITATGRARVEGDTIVVTSRRTFTLPFGDEVVVDLSDVYTVTGDVLTVQRRQTAGGGTSAAKGVYKPSAMMTVPHRYITATLLLLVASLWTAAGAQGPSRGQTQGYVPPPTGQPDLQGVWRVENLARYDVEAHAARPGIPASRGVVVDPPDGRIPYRPEALQKRDENSDSRNPDPWKSADPYHKCYSPGVPRLTYLGWPFQIYQTPR